MSCSAKCLCGLKINDFVNIYMITARIVTKKLFLLLPKLVIFLIYVCIPIEIFMKIKNVTLFLFISVRL